MRILFLSPRQCWPTRSGAKLREYHFLRGLAERFEVSYAHFTDPGATPLTRDDLPFCRQVTAVPKPPAYAAGALIRGVIGKWPLPVLNYTSAAMQTAVRELMTQTAFDFLHLDGIQMARYAPSGGPKIVYNWHNIESEAMLRYSHTVDSLPRRLYAQLTARKLARLEETALRTWFGHVVCSQREKDVLQQWPSGPRRVEVVENGVDVERFASAGQSSSSRCRKLLFVGLMDYFPNVEAVTSFANSVWPVLRQTFPELSFWIVGANPLPPVQALSSLPGVHVTGTVPSVQPYYGDALAAVVPLKTGGGTRLKILEAMAAGIPVISSRLGAEGLAIQDGRNILLADPGDTTAWVNHIRTLMDSEQRWRALTGEGRHLVQSHYDWSYLGSKLCQLYQQWADAPATAPAEKGRA